MKVKSISKIFHLLSIVSIILIINCETVHICLGARDNNSLIAYYLKIYNQINSYRSKHTTASLRWNRMLTGVAEALAVRLVQLSSNNSLIEGGPGYNFYLSSGSTRPSAEVITETWYHESINYDYKNPSYNPIYSNFTQMIWKSSTSVAIGLHTENNFTAVVARFYPAGNIWGKFRQNVIAKYEKM